MIIDCIFSPESLEASCVLVYREYDNPILIMITYYKQNTSFPVSITIDNPEGKLLLYLEEMALLILIECHWLVLE